MEGWLDEEVVRMLKVLDVLGEGVDLPMQSVVLALQLLLLLIRTPQQAQKEIAFS